jgi:hypothetical protein
MVRIKNGWDSIDKIFKIGNSSATSISKIKKSATKTKKRVEKGLREMLKGSNPHSKGVIFSSFNPVVYQETTKYKISKNEHNLIVKIILNTRNLMINFIFLDFQNP